MALPLVCDNGLFVSVAARLARDTPVAYFSSWHNAFPTAREFAPGTGIPNVERIDDPIQFMLDGKASHVIVPDLYLNGYERLARQLDIPVFGANSGTELETDRWHMAEYLDEHKQPVANAVEVVGLDELRKYLPKNPDKYIKVSVFRGDMETYHHTDWENSEPWFDKLKYRLGPLGNAVRFFVQDPIPSVCEVGIDTFYKGRWCSPMILGYEMKDAGYAGRLIDQLPEQFAPLFSALGKHFKKDQYNGFFSNEMRILKDGTIYMTDATCRAPSPPGGVMLAACNNFADVALDNADPDYGDAEYFCEVVLESEQVMESWMRVDFPKKFADRYAFHNYCVIDGKTWIIPHDSKYVEFGSALGWGKTLDTARGMALEAAEALKGDKVFYDKGVLDEAADEIAKGESLGL